jgi:hypothetical protein
MCTGEQIAICTTIIVVGVYAMTREDDTAALRTALACAIIGVTGLGAGFWQRLNERSKNWKAIEDLLVATKKKKKED